MRRETWLPAAALVMGLVLGAGTVAFTADDQPGGPRSRQGGGKHPYLTVASRALTQAESQLEKDAHNYGGHRAKALELVKQAAGQLKEALAYAEAHPDEFKQVSTPGAPISK
jgi:hypothetical protein